MGARGKNGQIDGLTIRYERRGDNVRPEQESPLSPRPLPERECVAQPGPFQCIAQINVAYYKITALKMYTFTLIRT